MEPLQIRSLVQRSGPLLLGALIGISGVGVVMLLSSPARGDPILLAEPADLRVHVAGEVLRPGVYELPIGSILQDAIDAAGGFRGEASQDRVNLAAALTDGQQVYVPAVSEAAPPGSDPVGSTEPISVNVASAPELERLPGIGPVIAQRIVEYREQNGPYQRLEDLLEVEGIGPAKLESLQEYVQLP
ncbi:MAG: ComEA family DNA-binding protein [Chloroflexi bacterium]|nr:MAG: ComEA family DNA-binding protein [Chloroflexota bacterium]